MNRLSFPTLLLFLLLAMSHLDARTRNAGLGPLEVRNHYPVTHAYLWMYPESTATLPDGEALTSYSFSMANTFVNTQGSTQKITKKEYDRGIVASDFESGEAAGQVVPNLGLYMDVESYRQNFRFKYGMSTSFEVSLEVPFLTMTGGVMDEYVEAFHAMVGVSDGEQEGAYREYSDRNKFGFYIARNGELLVANDSGVFGDTFLGKRGDTSLGAKWNVWEGGRIMPAFTLKLNYKVANGEKGDDGLTSSGSDDHGYMMTFSKGFDPWFVYFGQGMTNFGSHPNWISDSVFHRFISLEWMMFTNQSLVIQNVIQSSIYPAEGNPASDIPEEVRNYNLQASTALIMLGYKLQIYNLQFDTGFVQDYSNRGNETDFVVFFEAGLRW
jgi:hypothetical protein